MAPQPEFPLHDGFWHKPNAKWGKTSRVRRCIRHAPSSHFSNPQTQNSNPTLESLVKCIDLLDPFILEKFLGWCQLRVNRGASSQLLVLESPFWIVNPTFHIRGMELWSPIWSLELIISSIISTTRRSRNSQQIQKKSMIKSVPFVYLSF